MFNQMKVKAAMLGFVSASTLLGMAAQAAPINLLTNGSFEADGGSLTGWATAGTQEVFAPAAVVTNVTTSCCFGEAVPVDTVVGGSPDAAGTHGVYFVDDLAHQTLDQALFLAAGKYEVGFDAYSPFNGFANGGDALFSAKIAGIQFANYTVHTQNSPGVWFHFSTLADVLTSGVYGVTFEYQTFGGVSADVVIDRAYIAASDGDGDGIPIGPVPVPEPATLVLMGLGLIAAGVARRRKRTA